MVKSSTLAKRRLNNNTADIGKVTKKPKQLQKQPPKKIKLPEIKEQVKVWLALDPADGEILLYPQLQQRAKYRVNTEFVIKLVDGSLVKGILPMAMDQAKTVSVKLPDGKSATLYPQRQFEAKSSSSVTEYWLDNDDGGFLLREDLNFGEDNVLQGNFHLRGRRSDKRHLGRDVHPVDVVIRLDERRLLALGTYENYILIRPAERAHAMVGHM